MSCSISPESQRTRLLCKTGEANRRILNVFFKVSGDPVMGVMFLSYLCTSFAFGDY